MPKIRVHEKALGHLSRGLYRSPASALRELVSNSWDANATVVRIDTNAPYFGQLSVQDDGDGFTADEFERLMDGGIGNSEKGGSSARLSKGRPMIGRLGIGMLGMAQICYGFEVISKLRNGESFRATVRLFDLVRSLLDDNDPEVVVDDGNDRVVLIGEYTIEQDFDGTKLEHGTTIFTNDLEFSFTDAFSESYRTPPSVWRDFVSESGKSQTLQEMGDYWRLIWELSALCPVPYVNRDAVPGGLVRKDHSRLTSYGFQLFVDGLDLRKPIILKGNHWGYTTQPIDEHNEIVYSKPLRFHGYVIVQEAKQLQPDELRGILIRLREIGVGVYDHSLLDYRINEGPRSRWVTGEIFVDAGLADALNIDRDSFNRYHPEYRKLQQIVHSILKTKVFSTVYKNIDIRTKAKVKQQDARRDLLLRNVVKVSADSPVKVRTTKGREGIQGTSMVSSQSGTTMTVELPPTDTVRMTKRHRALARAIMAIYDVSMTQKTPTSRRKRFLDQLLRLLTKW